MNTKQFFSGFLAALFAVTYFPAEKASAQAQDGNFSSSPIDMVVDAGTNQERWGASQFGIMETIGLRPGEQITITLVAPHVRANSPIGVAPLDGGEIVAEDPVIDGDGLVSFTFRGGNLPGIYRVIATIGAEQYQLRFYVARPQDIPEGCQ